MDNLNILLLDLKPISKTKKETISFWQLADKQNKTIIQNKQKSLHKTPIVDFYQWTINVMFVPDPVRYTV